MNGRTLTIATRAGTRVVRLFDYLDAGGEEQARVDATAWIKAARAIPVDGQPMRRRFRFRGDSLWWFTEVYLHKEGVILELFRLTAALARLIEREEPVALDAQGADRLLSGTAAQMARARGIRYEGRSGFGDRGWTRLRLGLRARALTYAALASRWRPRRHRAVPPVQTSVAAFVHRAFWRGHGGAESYIGPVLDEIDRRVPAGTMRYISVGPAENFRARRWWHALPSAAHGIATPIEMLAPRRALRASVEIWRQRHTFRRALWSSDALARHAIIGGVDCWPVVREAFEGVALLQWPWSARTMDEAGAALDALRPGVVATYAEAGGWGRALILEARRRGIPTVGLQHGFIYRHWLNYLHEPDEMLADGSDAGFPRPDLTLLFDGYTAEHLAANGHFPPGSCEVAGSPRLDALVAATRALPPDAVARARRDAGASESQALVLVVTKFREARHALPSLIAAVRGMHDVQVAVKTHPAETPEVYVGLAAGAANVRVLPAAAPLAPLLAAARAIVTVNSTVALDGAVLGIPALVIGLPNNLSPFVDAGVMAGAAEDAVGPALRRILYDEKFRQQLEASRSVFLARYGIGSDGSAAERSAAAIVARLGRSDG